MNKEDLQANAARMEKELAEMKEALNKPEVRTMYDEVRAGDCAMRNDGEPVKITMPCYWVDEETFGLTFHSKELTKEHAAWLKARAYLVKRISEINKGKVPGRVFWTGFFDLWADDVRSNAWTHAVLVEKYLRISRALTSEELTELTPYYKTYLGVE